MGAVLVSACLAGQELVNDAQNATLTVSVSGTGNGTVTAVSSKSDYSTVFGRISCRKAAGTCTASTDLDEHGTTTITLTAAADSDSRFVSWEKCSATTADPLKATVELDAETGFECDATFDALPPTCDNPYVLDSDFEDDSVWELQLGGGQVAGSYPSFGGNPGAYRREEPARPANGFVSYTRYALRTEVYDPAVQGAIAGILYSEDRIVFGPLQAQEGITGGLFVSTQPAPVWEGHLDPENVLFTGNSWTTAAARFDPQKERDLTVPFRVGYFRRSDLAGGNGVVPNGIDNVRISICR